jgi:ComF family protein
MSSRRRRASSIPSNGSGETPSASTSLTSLLRSTLDGLIAVTLAPHCAACRAPLDHPTDGAVCSRCWDATVPPVPLASCSLPPHISRAVAIGLYADALRDIVHALKYDHRSTIAWHLAKRMRDAGGGVLDDADAVVPVPLARARQRSRGFNQARELARHLDLRMLDALTRVRDTAPQADLPAVKRAANVRGAFALRAGVSIDGLVLVLVDDVSTTGTTLNACAAVLLDGGAKEVRALTAARAPLRRKSAG